MLGITGAIVTYIASNYQDLTVFYAFASASAILMIWGAWQGTQGITELTNKGYQGEWSVETKKHRFDKQSGATLLGLFVLGVAVIVGFTAQPKPSQPPIVRVINAGNASIQAQLAKDKVKIIHIKNTLRHVGRELQHIRRQVDFGHRIDEHNITGGGS